MAEDTWEARMATRAKERLQRVENPAEFNRAFWRTSNVVFGRNGEILYPGGWMPCTACGQELAPEGWGPEIDHSFQRHVEASEEEGDEICVCGLHESYHRPHDCVKDHYELMPCACSGGQPWSCCMNRHARQEQFLFQKIANMLRAAADR